MTLSKADRAWIKKTLRASEDRIKKELRDVLTEEAQLALLEALRRDRWEHPYA